MLTPEMGISYNFKVEVVSTKNWGHSAEEVAELCIYKIVGISAMVKIANGGHHFSSTHGHVSWKLC